MEALFENRFRFGIDEASEARINIETGRQTQPTKNEVHAGCCRSPLAVSCTLTT